MTDHLDQWERECADRDAAQAHHASLEEAERILLALSSNPHISLVDQIYEVREREGEGWEDPSVKSWGAACAALAAWEKRRASAPTGVVQK